MAQSSLTHSLCSSTALPGPAVHAFWQQCALPRPRDLLFKTCLIVGRDRGWKRSLSLKSYLTIVLHLPSVWRLVAPSLPAIVYNCTVAPEGAESTTVLQP